MANHYALTKARIEVKRNIEDQQRALVTKYGVEASEDRDTAQVEKDMDAFSERNPEYRIKKSDMIRSKAAYKKIINSRDKYGMANDNKTKKADAVIGQ